MAPGGAWLALLFGLCHCRPPEPMPGQYPDEGQVSAPPELVAMIPAAVQATLAAGYTANEAETTTPALKASAAAVSPAPPASSGTVIAVNTPGVPTPAKESFLILGDTRYAWQEWSAWHCNCEAGSMSRVRDITYSVPGVRLDPAQYNVLRFEREVCSYKACGCDRAAHQCDRLQVSCDRGPVHLCALRDIELDQTRKRQRFWSKVHKGLKELWKSLKETFPSRMEKVFQEKSKQ